MSLRCSCMFTHQISRKLIHSDPGSLLPVHWEAGCPRHVQTIFHVSVCHLDFVCEKQKCIAQGYDVNVLWESYISILGVLWYLAYTVGTQKDSRSLCIINMLNLNDWRHVKVHFLRSLWLSLKETLLWGIFLVNDWYERVYPTGMPPLGLQSWGFQETRLSKLLTASQ